VNVQITLAVELRIFFGSLAHTFRIKNNSNFPTVRIKKLFNLHTHIWTELRVILPCPAIISQSSRYPSFVDNSLSGLATAKPYDISFLCEHLFIQFYHTHCIYKYNIRWYHYIQNIFDVQDVQPWCNWYTSKDLDH
jgi:hypothetical protein